MLTFELADNGERVEIHGDKDGLMKLSDLLRNLANKENFDHIHLMTDSWGGPGLTDEKQGLNNILVNHVKIFVWK